MHTLPTPELKFFADLSVQVDKPQEVGKTHHGVRRVIPILGGTVEAQMAWPRLVWRCRFSIAAGPLDGRTGRTLCD